MLANIDVPGFLVAHRDALPADGVRVLGRGLVVVGEGGFDGGAQRPADVLGVAAAKPADWGFSVDFYGRRKDR